jgi:hypothetical protein
LESRIAPASASRLVKDTEITDTTSQMTGTM